MKKIILISFLSSLCFAKTEGLHEPDFRKLLRRAQNLQRKVDLCTLTNINLKSIGEILDQEICDAKKIDDSRPGQAPKVEKHKLKVTRRLLERALGKSFVTGDPCSAPAENPPAASPRAIKEGIREVLKEACREQWLNQNMHDMRDISVSSQVMDKIDSLGLYHPFSCVPREVHK